MNNETECFVKYGAEFENLVEEDNGILSLIAYRNIAPNGNEIDRVMGLADKQLIEKFKDYKSLKGSYKNYVLQEYADSYFRDGVVLEVDYKFSNYMKNLISEVYEQQLSYEESLKVFKVNEIERDRYKANIENAQQTVIRIQEEDFKSLESERIKHRF